jgi:PAS domain S-box-containing protein
METIPDHIWIKDKDYRYVYVNESYYKSRGKTKAQIIGSTLYDLYSKELADFFTEQDRQVFNKGIAIHIPDEYFPDANGAIRRIYTIKTPLKDASGNVTHLVGTARDITELRKMEEKLREAKRLAAIGELAAMVAHDIRNPLQGIAGAAYCLKQHIDIKDEKAKEMLKIIDNCITNSDKIVNDLLEYSRETWVEPTETNLQQIIKIALDTAKVPEYIQVTDLTESSLRITVDPEKVRRVFVNLITNAIDVMPDGGKLTITSKESNSNVEMLISDTGTGMTKETMEKLW